MDSDEERDFADQGPLTDMDMEEDAEMLALLLKHMPSCIDAADIEQLLRDIPDQPPVVIPVRTVQEAVAAGDLPPLDADAANVSRSLEADLADAAQEEDDDAQESAVASAVDKEGEAGACELGIRYPTLQCIYAGKSNKQSIQVNIMYDI